MDKNNSVKRHYFHNSLLILTVEYTHLYITSYGMQSVKHDDKGAATLAMLHLSPGNTCFTIDVQ